MNLQLEENRSRRQVTSSLTQFIIVKAECIDQGHQIRPQSSIHVRQSVRFHVIDLLGGEQVELEQTDEMQVMQ